MDRKIKSIKLKMIIGLENFIPEHSFALTVNMWVCNVMKKLSSVFTEDDKCQKNETGLFEIRYQAGKGKALR